MTTEKKLIECYVEDRADFRMRPAPHKREWMDNTPDTYAYRCLPLAIANAHGWEILNIGTFEAKWTGGKAIEDIIFATPDGKKPTHVASHFGDGVLTFHVNCLFRTPPGYDLWVMGPTNQFKPYIQALNAEIETDWSPYTFTMNWKFTQAGGVVKFEENEPFATIFPIQRGEIESFQPVLRTPQDNEELWAEFSAWRDSRTSFNEELQEEGSNAQQQKWQKAYMTGPEKKLIPKHRTKLRLSGLSKK